MGGGKSDSFYGKIESQMIAGIAILLMIWHHLFTYPNWLIDEVQSESLLGKNIDNIVWLTARLGNICIFLFAFQSGYTIYERHDLYDTPKKRLKRIFMFLLSYWMVCISFWIFGLIFNDNMPTHQNALLNLFGIGVGFFSDWINVTFAWYVLYYILLIISVPVLYKCFNTNNPYLISFSILGCIAIILILSIWGITEYWNPFMASILGILTAKHRFLEYLYKHIDKYIKNGWCYLMVLLGVLFVRTLLLYWGKQLNDEIFYPVIESIVEACIALGFVFSFLSMMRYLNNKWITSALCFMGGISMFLWFLHGILFTGSRFLQHYFYYPKEPIVIYILTLVVFIPIAMGFNRTYMFFKDKIFAK